MKPSRGLCSLLVLSWPLHLLAAEMLPSNQAADIPGSLRSVQQSLPEQLEGRKKYCPPAADGKVDPRPCENLWKHACEQRGNKSFPGEEEATRIYNQAIEPYLSGMKAEFEAAAQGTGNPDLWPEDVNVIIAAYQDAVKGEDVDPLMLAQKMLVYHPILPLNDERITKKLEEFARTVGDADKTLGFLDVDEMVDEATQAAVDGDKKYFAELFAKAAKLLPHEKFVDLSKDLAVSMHRMRVADIRDKVLNSTKFRQTLMNDFLPDIRRHRLEDDLGSIRTIAASIPYISDKADLGVKLGFFDNADITLDKMIITRQNGGYSRNKNIIKLNGGLVVQREKAPFQVFKTLAHEYGHALSLLMRDPALPLARRAADLDARLDACKWEPILAEKPKGRLTSEQREARKQAEQKAKDRIHNPWFDALGTCLTSGRSAAKNTCQGEEAFADWFATEALARYLEKQKPPLNSEAKKEAALSTVVNCTPVEKFPADDPHPDPESRVNRIFMAHPYFRSLFGCGETSDPAYCSDPGIAVNLEKK